MTGGVRSELLKLRSTRTSIGFLLGLLAIVLLVVPLQGFASPQFDLHDLSNQRTLFGVGSIASGFAAFLGIVAMAGEFRHGTIRPTLLFAPRRGRLVAAKVAAAFLAGVLLAVGAEAVNLGFGLLVLHVRGIPLVVSSRDLALQAAGVVAGAALWASLGVGLGAAIRSQVGAIVALTAWMFIVESILLAFVPSAGRFMPGNAANALAGAADAHLLSPAAGGAVFGAWALACVAAGLVLFARRDVG